MRIGVPTEVKDNEQRVALTPAGAHALVADGHEVLVQSGAGTGASLADAAYAAAGATVVDGPDAAARVWGEAELVLKVKEPVASEYPLLRKGLVLFTYLHLAADRDLTETLLERRVTSLAYETVRTADGALPLLAPMSEIAGRLAVQEGAHLLTAPQGGNGTLLGGAAGVERGRVVVIGGGTAGLASARVADGMGADVTVLDISPARLRYLEETSGGRLRTLFSTPLAVEEACLGADLVIGAVLVPGARAPHLVASDLVARMRPGSVLVDIAIDQGGCFEDSRPTTHTHPAFRVHGSVLSCVANLPGAVPRTSTHALTNATLPYVRFLAGSGWRKACTAQEDLAQGLATHDGTLLSAPVGEALNLASQELASVLD